MNPRIIFVFTLAAVFLLTACSTRKDTISSDETKSNSPPIAIIKEIGTLSLFDRAQLDGSKSYDPDEGEISYQWTMKSKPKNSIADLDFLDSANPGFMPDAHGDYVIQLVVTDELGLESSPAVVTITPYKTTETPALVQMVAKGAIYLIVLAVFAAAL